MTSRPARAKARAAARPTTPAPTTRQSTDSIGVVPHSARTTPPLPPIVTVVVRFQARPARAVIPRPIPRCHCPVWKAAAYRICQLWLLLFSGPSPTIPTASPLAQRDLRREFPRSVPEPAASQGRPPPWLEHQDTTPETKMYPLGSTRLATLRKQFSTPTAPCAEKVARHDDVLRSENINQFRIACIAHAANPLASKDFILPLPFSIQTSPPTPLPTSVQKWTPPRNRTSGGCKRLLWRYSAPQLKYPQRIFALVGLAVLSGGSKEWNRPPPRCSTRDRDFQVRAAGVQFDQTTYQLEFGTVPQKERAGILPALRTATSQLLQKHCV